MCLEQKGVAWTSRYIDLFRFDQMTPEYLAINPAGLVPTLVVDGRAVTESSVINEYIDDAFDGPKLKPSDPMMAAHMRAFIKITDDEFPAVVMPTFVKYILPKLRNRWSDEELHRQADRRPTEYYREIHGRGVRGEVSPEEVEKCLTRFEKILDRMEALLGRQYYLFGSLSLADIAVAPYLFRMSALGQDRFWSATNRPLVAGWYHRMYELPSFQAAVRWPDETGGGYEEVGLKETAPG